MNLDIKSIALPMGNFQHLKSKLQPLISNPVGKQAFKKLSSGYKTAMDNLNNVTCKDLNEGLKISFKSQAQVHLPLEYLQVSSAKPV